MLQRERNSRYIVKPLIHNEAEFLRKLDSANSTKRHKERMAALHQKKYMKQWEHPSIMRLTRDKGFHLL